MRRFVPWIEAHDEHARAHLHLLEEAAAALETTDPPDGQVATLVVDPALADRLERWRYHLLNRHAGALSPTDARLANALDVAARKLASRPCTGRLLGPRSPREALRTCRRTAPAAARGCATSPNDRVLERVFNGPPNVDYCRETRLDRDTIYPCFDSDSARRRLVRRATELTVIHHSVRTAPGESKRSVFLFAPLYLSNYCVNFCDYCWFRYPQPLERTHLRLPQVLQQAQILRDRGLNHLLLVAGDYPKLVTPDYLSEIISALVARDFSVAVEIAPQSTASYARLVEAGACGITLYQETYDEPLYARYHSRGTKSSFDWRLEGLDRAAEAGMRHLGMGVLLGLGDPREELACTIRHGQYLQKRFPDVRLSFGLPRLHDVPAGFRNFSQDRADNRPPSEGETAAGRVAIPCKNSSPVGDRTFALLYCFLRIAFPHAQLVLSTRETPSLRRELIKQCVTQISAGSSTSPGGYTQTDAQRRQSEQFPISDERSPAEVARQLEADGFHVQWQLAEEGRG